MSDLLVLDPLPCVVKGSGFGQVLHTIHLKGCIALHGSAQPPRSLFSPNNRSAPRILCLIQAWEVVPPVSIRT